METTQRVIRFREERSFLSNFYNCRRVHAWGETFTSVEAAYQYKQAVFKGDNETAQLIKKAKSGREAKRLSKRIKVRTFEEWSKSKRAIMYALLTRKFKDGDLARQLIDTGNMLLVEQVASALGYWGLSRNGTPGKNVLGELLMEVRARLQKQ